MKLNGKLGSKLFGDAYDGEEQKFKAPIVPFLIFGGSQLAFFMISFFTGIPVVFTASSFIFSLSLVALFHDHYLINSAVVPPAIAFFVIGVISIQIPGIVQFWSGLFHLAGFVLMVIVAVTRRRFSFVAMIGSTLLYAAWIYAVILYVSYPLYDCSMYWYIYPFFCQPELKVGSLFFSGISVSVVMAAVTRWRIKRSGVPSDCGFGMCPL